MRLRELRGSAFDFLFIYFLLLLFFYSSMFERYERIFVILICVLGGGERGIVEKRNSLGEKQFFAEEKYFGEKFFPLRYEF